MMNVIEAVCFMFEESFVTTCFTFVVIMAGMNLLDKSFAITYEMTCCLLEEGL